MALEKKRAKRTRDTRDQTILVKDANIWTGHSFVRGSILIEEGRISRIARRITDTSVRTIDASGLHVLPGLLDVHVHLRDMKLSYKEDFATGTAAAAAGGFTTVLDMPNTSPPTDSPARLVEKIRRAERKVHVNVGFHVAARSDQEMVSALAKAGAFSLKLYMPKPIAPFEVDDDATVQKLMDDAKKAKIPVTVHAEDFDGIEQAGSGRGFEELALSRRPILETNAVRRILKIQRRGEARVHFCHITLRSSLEMIATSSRRVTSEVTPHHVLLSASILRRIGWKGWMVPPLRRNAERDALMNAMVSGRANVVASDHAPHTIDEKDQPDGKSLPGVPGLETTLPLMLTLVAKRVLTMSRLVKLLAEHPAEIFGLKSKARLQRGFDGDLVLVDLKKRSRVDPGKFYSKARFSPFDKFQTIGAVNSTIVGGRLVYHQGDIVGKEGSGSVLKSGTSG